jgi:predicted RNase H-like HicB family nuclease
MFASYPQRLPEPHGGYTVQVPELPGCLTEGDDLAEAKCMAKDAIELWLSVAEPQRSRAKSRSR